MAYHSYSITYECYEKKKLKLAILSWLFISSMRLTILSFRWLFTCFKVSLGSHVWVVSNFFCYVVVLNFWLIHWMVWIFLLLSGWIWLCSIMMHIMLFTNEVVLEWSTSTFYKGLIGSTHLGEDSGRGKVNWG